LCWHTIAEERHFDETFAHRRVRAAGRFAAGRSRTRYARPVQQAAQGNMPERFLLQILRNLVNHGILHSTRGVDGGYSLECRADEISLLDLIEAVDGPVFAYAPLGEGLSQELVDQLSKALKEVTTATRKQLANIKLSTLVSHRRKANHDR
jgi:Rrf2 family protein